MVMVNANSEYVQSLSNAPPKDNVFFSEHRMNPRIWRTGQYNLFMTLRWLHCITSHQHINEE